MRISPPVWRAVARAGAVLAVAGTAMVSRPASAQVGVAPPGLQMPPPAALPPVPPPPGPAAPAPPPSGEPPLAAAAATAAPALPEAPSSLSMEIYGFAMTDVGYDFGRIDPAWFDVMRPTKLPASADALGRNGAVFAGVRQTRFGVKSALPTPLGEMKTIFEWDLFGVGVDAGQTTLRLRHAYGEIGPFGAGQTWSPFMDIDVFPRSIEYWGPNGMAFFRNVQVRWMPLKGDTRITFALERPGVTADGAPYAERIELMDVVPRFPLPDFSGEFRLAGSAGYIKVSGLVRYINWDDLGADAFNLGGNAFGWGASVSGNIKLWQKNVLKLQLVGGRGIANYMNDAGADVGAKNNPGNVVTPITGQALPLVGAVAFADFYWSPLCSSSVGYSIVNMWNSDAESPSAFHRGHYALANLLFYPTSQSMAGVEVQYGRRVNAFDDFTFDAFKVQLSFRYDFSVTLR
jgi:hypothetical protein